LFKDIFKILRFINTSYCKFTTLCSAVVVNSNLEKIKK